MVEEVVWTGIWMEAGMWVGVEAGVVVKLVAGPRRRRPCIISAAVYPAPGRTVALSTTA